METTINKPREPDEAIISQLEQISNQIEEIRWTQLAVHQAKLATLKKKQNDPNQKKYSPERLQKLIIMGEGYIWSTWYRIQKLQLQVKFNNY